jgi:outer membrane protein TolC
MSLRSARLRVSHFLLVLSALFLLFLSGCVLKPAGMGEHQAELAKAGETYAKPHNQRALPELPSPATWQDVLHRALLANGDLEAAYWEWNAAVARIDQEAAYPNSNINLGFDYMFSRQSMKAWDRTTLSAGFDPQTGGLMWPTKVAKAGEIALASARAAGERFRAAKFSLQQRVLSDYLELALAEERYRVQEANLSLISIMMDTAAQRVAVGGPQQDLLKLRVEYDLAANQRTTLASQVSSQRARLNGMLAREPDAALELPAALPAARAVSVSDDQLFSMATGRSPRLSELAHQMQGRTNAIELARQAYIPDISPTAAITGSVSQAIGAMVMIPSNFPKIRAAIREQEAMLRSTQAMARQSRSDIAAEFVARLYAMRNAQRQAQVFEQQVMPAADQAAATMRQAYAVGSGTLADVIDAQRVLLDVRLMAAEARIEREMQLVALEAIAAVDIETISQPATRPATAPATAGARE